MVITAGHFTRALELSPFAPRIEALSQVEQWTGWNGFKAARVIDQLSSEYFAVRSGCSVMDLTPMEKYRIRGKDAFAFLDRLVTRNISKLRPGRVTYVVWCNDEGKLLDDGTLFQLGENDFRLCSQHHQLDWLMISAAGFDVEISCETHEIAALAVQGPTSCAVLKECGFSGVEEITPFGLLDIEFGNTSVGVSRTGYTGDLGYELWMDPSDALDVWDSIFGVSHLYDIHAIGLSALDMVRIEAGFVMPGFDFNTAETVLRAGYDRSPYEAGLGWVVDLEKGHFTGRQVLLEEVDRPPLRGLHKIVVGGNKPVANAILYDKEDGEKTGEIKAATWSPILKKNLALADILYEDGKLPEKLWARVEYQRELDWFARWESCEYEKKSFMTLERRTRTPPDTR